MNYKIPIDIPEIQYFTEQAGLHTESGAFLPNFTLAYHTYGRLHEGSKVIWVCHALTANSHVTDWWAGLFGEGRLFDPEQYFIVCSNILGSCYGSTGAASIDPNTGLPYGLTFPNLTIRDLAQAQIMLMKHLEIKDIFLCIGGSCGGHQALELGILLSSKIKNLALLVCGARESAWSIAIHEAQRMALVSDPTLHDVTDISSGARGLAAARGIGLLMYRTYEQYVHSQTSDISLLDNFRASSYLQYQGEKLVKRFYAKNYYSLTKVLDTHQVGRNRGGIEVALAQVNAKTLIISIDSDLLIPVAEQEILARHIPKSTHQIICSRFGHDGFLIETEKIAALIQKWLV